MISSPRKIRPHTIVIKHKIGEDDDFNAVYEETHIDYVKFEPSRVLQQSSEGKQENLSSLLVIDCNDLHARKNYLKCRYVNYRQYSNSQEGIFSIFVGDIIVWSNNEYVVTNIDEICPFGDIPVFIEVRCNG